MRCWVFKKVTFDAAHHLPKHEGNCKNLHGHTYIVELGVRGEIDMDTGMVTDMINLKEFLKVNVIARFDHRDLNEFFRDPTAETIAAYIIQTAQRDFRNYDIKVRVYETPDSWVEIFEQGEKDGKEQRSEPSPSL